MVQIKGLKREPVITSYRDVSILYTLRDWFYDFGNHQDNRKKAVERVRALRSRGRVPHAVESTSNMTSIILDDEGSMHLNVDPDTLRLSYSMAIVRFVNGHLDPHQQGAYAIPLHQLAKNLNLPSFFVEMRHMATHEGLPSLNFLRHAVRQALNWLHLHYWEKLEENSTLKYVAEPEGSQDNSPYNSEFAKEVIENLKIFKRIRKQNLDQEIKYGNSTDIGKRYWKAIGNLKKASDDNVNVLFSVMVCNNFLMYNGEKLEARSKKKFKFNTLFFKLYKPLLDELGVYVCLELLQFLLSKCKEYAYGLISDFDKLHMLYFTSDLEVLQAKAWIMHLVDALISPARFKADFSLVTSVLNLAVAAVRELPTKDLLDLLGDLETQINTPPMHSGISVEMLQSLISIIREAKLESLSLSFPPSLSDILHDSLKEASSSLPASKKLKLSPNVLQNKKAFFFEPYDKWSPLPFGVSSLE